MSLAPIETYLGECENLARDKRAGAHHSRALLFAVAEAWTARAKLADARSELRIAADAIDRVLETGLPLTGHGIHDSHYSKVTVAATSANYRAAIHRVRQERERFESVLAEHVEALRRFRTAS